MLKHLHLRNIVLLEQADLEFSSGLNILSGETGAGKSVIMEALRLVLGHRAEKSLLRHACEEGWVKAAFELEADSPVLSILKDAGIRHEDAEYLLISRELKRNDRNRSFINHQMIQLSLLRDLSSYLVDIVEQHSHHQLKSTDYHLQVLDCYGHLDEDLQIIDTIAKLQDHVAEVEVVWDQCKTLRLELDELLAMESQRERDRSVCRMEIEEIQKAELVEGEEEELFEEYKRLCNADELRAKVDQLYVGISDDQQSLLSKIFIFQPIANDLAEMDPSLESLKKGLNDARVELEELAYTLRSQMGRLQRDPERMLVIDERLSQIVLIKKKYGSTVSEVQVYLEKKIAELQDLENVNARTGDVRLALFKAEKRCDALCLALTKKRKETAEHFEKAVTKELRELNMPKAHFQVKLSKRARTQMGDDRVQFFLAPNLGEQSVPLSECASGGELSRTFLALKTVLAGLEDPPTIVFDEIDANMGGETGTIVGKKLLGIARERQVLCITHLPQVARQAKQHLQISKGEKDSRTVTTIRCLNEKERRDEILRMMGGELIV